MPAHSRPTEFLTFDLRAGAATTGGYPVTVVHSPAGEGSGFCRLDPTDLAEALDALARRKTDAALLAELGSFLFDALFTGEVADLYRVSLGLARSEGKRLRLRLSFAPAELAALPWEYLYDGREDAFLAAASDTPLVRYTPMRVPARPAEVEGPLRVLAVIASPSDFAPLDVRRERAILQEALAERIAAGVVQLQVLEQATVAAINAAMRSFRPHIFHFVGHSQFHQERASVLLQGEDGRAHPVDELTFQAFFAGAAETRLAVLNACQSAAVSREQPLVGLAPRLLQRQLAAVVGMQFPIAEATSLIFTREFYRCLALGYPVDAAVAEARKGIFQEVGPGAPDWGIPVLYLRAKDGQLFRRQEAERVLPAIVPPPAPVQPPEVEGFVGRAEELAFFAARLAQVKLAVITGMPGVGKTALAAVLARQHGDPQRVFWHSFHEGEGVEVITWKLAAFLAHNDQNELWRLLESARQTGGQSPPAETILDYLLQTVRGRGYLLCFDDFHHVDEDPILNQLVERLRGALAAGELAIVITGRRMPEFVQLAEFPALAGLGGEDVRRLLRLHNLELADALHADLVRATGGNAEFLVLAVDALKQASDPQALIARLAESDDIARYLMREVDSGLNGVERAVMGAVAVFLNYGATREAIEAVLDAGSVVRVLRNLADRQLLAVQSAAAGREYRQHAIVQAFYYEATGLRQRRQMHRRAGDYYAGEESDRLRAALHYERSGEYALAAGQATADVWGAINQGNARLLATLLARFSLHQLSRELWVRVNLARGAALGFLGDRATAAGSYQEALAQLASPAAGAAIDDAPALTARACRGMGELLEDESPQEALGWFRRGLEAVGDADATERAALLIKSGMMEIYMGSYAAAEKLLDGGMSLLPPGPSALRATALAQIANVFMYQGDIRRAQSYTEQALAICEQVEDHFLRTLILGNLGMFKHVAGDWPGAIAHFEEALDWIDRLGNEKQRAYMALNLGAARLYCGDFVQAGQQLTASCTMAERYQDRLTELRARYYLAELHMRQGQWSEAALLLQEVEVTAGEVDDQEMLVWVYAGQAEVELALGRPEQAQAIAQRAVEQAEALDTDPDRAIALRALGHVLAGGRGQYGAALEAFVQSAACLGDSDPYELARTQVQWGLALLAAGDGMAGQAQLQEAQETLRKLGALHELAQVAAVLPG